MADGEGSGTEHPIGRHFDGERFFNPKGVPPNGLREMIRWQLGARDRVAWPDHVPVPRLARPAPQVEDMTVTMVGHATLLIQTAGVNILTDPVWSDRCSPVQFAGPARTTVPGIAFGDLPRIDLVLLSHNHYDHLDRDTLARLERDHAPVVVTPLKNDEAIGDAVARERILVRDWGQSVRVGPLTVHLEPCHHWSARGIFDRRKALWAAFVVEGPAGRILHIGDTGFDAGRPYRDLPGRFGTIRLAALPIGSYEPRWFMKGEHQNPAEAVEGMRLSGAAYAVAHHWGTFRLTDEARDAPPLALAEALRAQGVAPERFPVLHPGESFAVPMMPADGPVSA